MTWPKGEKLGHYYAMLEKHSSTKIWFSSEVLKAI